MSIENTRPRSRRAVLTAAVGGAAAVAVASVARVAPVSAANGDHIAVGGNYEGTQGTSLVRTAGGASAFHVSHKGTGAGVVGVSNHGFGTGVLAASENGVALAALGRVQFHKVSGVATIGKGRRSKTVDPGVSVSGGSFVLLTPMNKLGGRDLWFRRQPVKNKFVIHMSKARGTSTQVAWLLVG
jgi:hypothetical protein